MSKKIAEEYWEHVTIIETYVDDIIPEDLSLISETIRQIPTVLDVIVIPIQMKKGRIGFLIQVITRPSSSETVAINLMKLTGSLGVRISEQKRIVAKREVLRKKIQISGQEEEIGLKIGYIGSTIINIKPEFEEIKMLAQKYHKSPQTIRQIIFNQINTDNIKNNLRNNETP